MEGDRVCEMALDEESMRLPSCSRSGGFRTLWKYHETLLYQQSLFGHVSGNKAIALLRKRSSASLHVCIAHRMTIQAP